MTDELFLKLLFSQSGILFRLCFSILKNREDAEDALAEMISKIWEKRSVVKNTRNINAYIYTATKNLCFDKLRAKKLISPVFDQNIRSSNRNIEEVIDGKEQLSIVSRIMELLPEKQRMAIHLRMVEGADTKMIAALLGEKENTIEVYISRARKKIREEYEKYIKRGY